MNLAMEKLTKEMADERLLPARDRATGKLTAAGLSKLPYTDKKALISYFMHYQMPVYMALVTPSETTYLLRYGYTLEMRMPGRLPQWVTTAIYNALIAAESRPS